MSIIERFIPEVTHLIDRGDWYELFQSAYESGFKNDDFREMIEMFMKADIYDDKAMEERLEFFLDYLKQVLSYPKPYPRSMSQVMLRDMDEMFVGFDDSEARKIIIESLKKDKLPGYALDTSLGTVKVIQV